MKELRIESLLDLEKTIASSIFENIKYPWDVLDKIEKFIFILFSRLSEDEFDVVDENVYISKSSSISKNCFINGPCLIDSNAQIRNGAFIRGNVIVGKNCVVGNSSELKNCILFDNVQVPHFNYVGDSIMGFKSHMGAGAIISNVKSDKKDVVVKIGDEKINTNLRKFGAIVGDHVEIGCNAVLNPGSVIGRESIIYPLSMVRGYVGEKKIFKNIKNIVDRI